MNNQSRYTILAVNDCRSQLELVKFSLEQAGYNVLTAADGDAALKILRRNKPDLVISDVTTPDGGVDLCRRLRADEKFQTLPILLVSALRKDSATIAEALDAGADDYLEIPFDPIYLAAIVARLVERRQAETIVRENYFRSLVENVSDIVSILSIDGIVLYESPSVKRILGYEPEDLIGKNAFDFIHPGDRKSVVEYFNRAVKGAAVPTPIEFRFRHGDDSWRDIESVGKIIEDRHAGGTAALVNSRDVTERRQAQKALRESEERFKAQYKGIPLPTYTWEKTADDFVLASYNDAAEKVTKGKIAGWLGFKASEMYADIPEIPTNFQRCLDGGEVIRHELNYRFRTTGEVRQLDMTYVCVPPNIVMVHTRDITEQREAENARRETEEKFRKVLENSRDVIYQLNLKAGTLDYMSPSVREITGYDYGEFLRGGFDFCFSLVHPDDLPIVRRHVKNTLDGAENDRKNSNIEYRLKTKENGYRWISENRVVVRDAENVPTSIIAVARDITEQKEAAAKLQFQKTLLESQSEASIDGILIVSTGGEIILHNRRFTEMWEIPDSVLHTKSDETALKNVVDKLLDPEEFLDTVYRLYQNPDETNQTEITLKDGRVFERYSAPVKGDDGELYGRVWFFHDITQRRRSEEKLRESEYRYRKLIDLSPCAIIVHTEGKIAFVNPAAVKLFGAASEKQLIDCPMMSLVHPDYRQLVLTRVEKLKTGEPAPMVKEKFVRLDGEIIDVEVTGIPLTFTGIPGVQVIARDITERKKAEDAIHFQAHLLDTVEQSVIATNLDGEIIYWNRFAEKLYGWTAAEAVSRSVTELTKPDTERAHATEIMAQLSKGESWTGEFTVRSKDGESFPALVTNSPIYDENGRLIGIVGISNDISEQKRAETAIVEANERAIREYNSLLQRLSNLGQTVGIARDLNAIFAAILDFTRASAPCSALIISLIDNPKKRRKIIYCWYNGGEMDVTDLEFVPLGEGIVGQAVKSGDVVINNDYLNALQQKGRIVNLGFDEDEREPQSVIIVPMWIKGSSIGVIEVQSYEPAAYRQEHATAMSMAGSIIANAIENVRLIELERRREEHLRQSQKLESVGRLAGGIAHDFNNMLTAINGYSSLTLRRMSDDDPLRQNIEEIRKAGERSANLTRQLLAFSRRQVLKPKVVDINQTVDDITLMLKRLIGEDVQLVTVLSPEIGQVKVDPGQLSQVIMNLAVNARDAMPDGGTLTIDTSNIYLDEEYAASHVPTQAGHYVMLSVSDTGAGIDPATLEHIFEPFFTTKDIGKGTGLGLATVYGIVKQSGGYIWVDSESKQGATFKIYLPRIDEQYDVEERHAFSGEMAIGTEKILLVEDEPLVRSLSRRILEDCGYTVSEAGNGIEALEICGQGKCVIDLLITDIVMPQMGGRELAEKLAAEYPQLKVLFTSGYTDDSVVRHGMVEAEINFIQKPFTPTALALKVRRTLDIDK